MGVPALILVSGEPGIGKTWFATEAVRKAASRGMGAVWGQSWEGGGAPAYWPWTQVIRSLLQPGRQKSALPTMAPEIGQLIPELAPEGHIVASRNDPEEARFR